MKFLSRFLLWWLLPASAFDVLAERRRQVAAEGWTVGHDDAHTDQSLAMVAALYAAPVNNLGLVNVNAEHVSVAPAWPASWDRKWDKRPTHPRRRRLVIAGALIQAELERLDRAEAKRLAPYLAGRVAPANLFKPAK